MTSEEKDMAKVIADSFAEKFVPETKREDDDTLVEKPFVVKFKGRTVCYCTDEESAFFVSDAIRAQNKLFGLFLASMVCGGKDSGNG